MKKRFYAIPVVVVIVLVAIIGFSYAVYNPYLTPYLPGSSATTGLTTVRVKSQTMEPTIMNNALVACDKTSFENLTVANIIVYKLDNGNLITSRVFDIQSDGIITKGDCNQNPDPFIVTSSMYFGKVNQIFNP
ncbi:signal peptidase I [Candidatus Bathyarchaeota archaeon]|nr:signal peptidase I [Candidatus Bathyarchaeota archaeon]